MVLDGKAVAMNAADQYWAIGFAPIDQYWSSNSQSFYDRSLR
jgi:hypothetical protein